MSYCDLSVYLSAVKWGNEGFYLKEFVDKFHLPQVAKLVKGQCPGLPFFNQVLLLADGGKRIKVTAQCVKFKDNHRVVPVGPKLAIPENYNGWFEILSEEGRAMRSMESVAELITRFPRSCVIKDNMKVTVARSDSNNTLGDKTKIIPAGEMLVLVDEVEVSLGKSKPSTKYLRCSTSVGDIVYLDIDSKGRFCTVAKEDNISGVHSIKNLMAKRFPMMVRLVDGKPPGGLKSQFVPEMRLYSIVEEKSIVAIPLFKDVSSVALPPNVPLKLQAPRNSDILVKLRQYSALSEKSRLEVKEISDKIHVFDTSDKELKNRCTSTISFLNPRRNRKEIDIRRSLSDPQGNKTYQESDVNTSNDRMYEEIDQIYDYVRGFAPLPKNVKNDFPGDTPNDDKTAEVKSDPPAVDAIPSKNVPKDNNSVSTYGMTVSALCFSPQLDKKSQRLSKKRNKIKPAKPPSRTIGKGTVEMPNYKTLVSTMNSQKSPQKTRFLSNSKGGGTLPKDSMHKSIRQKTFRSSKSLTTSPLFNIRYKSLTNVGNNLASNNSAGQASSVSSGSRSYRNDKIKRKKLPRPKSMSNLLHSYIIRSQEQHRRTTTPDISICQTPKGLHNRSVGMLYL